MTAIIVIVVAIIISVSLMAIKITKPADITGNAVSEGILPNKPLLSPTSSTISEPSGNFSAKNTIFAVLLAITVIAGVVTARRIVNPAKITDIGYNPEIKQAQSRAKVKNILNNFIKASVESSRTEEEIIKTLAEKGWPEEYVRRYVEHYIKNI